jgi:hypothetical protein
LSFGCGIRFPNKMFLCNCCVLKLILSGTCSSSVKECLRGELSQESLRAWWLKETSVKKLTTTGGLVNGCSDASNKLKVNPLRIICCLNFVCDNVNEIARSEQRPQW